MIEEFAAASAAISNLHWDVCIVGAGPVGLCLALNLVKSGRKVVVLEAGGRNYEASVQQLYAGSTDGNARFDGLTEGRFRGLGGTSTQWGGQILEIDSHIFEHRSWIEGSGWPISKAALAPYYERALAFEGLPTSPLDHGEIWRKRELAEPDLGPLLATDLSLWCPERDMARRHSEAINSANGLTILLHANVCAFELDNSGQRIVSAICRNAKPTRLRSRRRPLHYASVASRHRGCCCNRWPMGLRRRGRGATSSAGISTTMRGSPPRRSQTLAPGTSGRCSTIFLLGTTGSIPRSSSPRKHRRRSARSM